MLLTSEEAPCWQLILTIAGMVSVINSVIVGVVMGALMSRLAPGVTWAQILVGGLVFVAAVALHQHIQMAWRTREPSPLPPLPTSDR